MRLTAICFSVIFTLAVMQVFSQVSIGGSPPDSSAMLDLQSTERGLLVPRMSTTEMHNIDSPALGLIIFNTTVKTLFSYNGSDWNMMENRDGESCDSVTYEGQTYATVIIGEQCWMAENLNVGIAIIGSNEQTNNTLIEKYCYNNEEDSCDIYGGLYQWAEMVQYLNGATNTTSWDPVPTGHVQGICPPGWHIPTDEEWKILEGHVDTQYPVGDPEWDGISWRGYDAGKRLKSTSGWVIDYGTDAFNFNALPGGYRLSIGVFNMQTYSGKWWSSSEYGSLDAWHRYLYYNTELSSRSYGGQKDVGYSVRCLKD